MANHKIQDIIDKVGSLIPQFMSDPIDAGISGGNVAICIIEADGTVHGKLYGENKIRNREIFKVAWTKASQVWITGMKTGDFEKLVFNDQIDDRKYGILRPDFIGWEGGQPITLKDGTVLSIGFSGFRGTSDLGIIVQAINQLGY